jgi:formamidopyrimidine-DNA glycosylase
MPELPEVQTTVNGLNANIRGLSITDVWTDYNSAFHTSKDSIKDPVYFRNFKKKIIGRKIANVTRRAKNILIGLDNGDVILIHMKMTGHIMCGRYIFEASKKRDPWTPALDERESLSDPFNRFIHFVLTFSNGKNMVLSDMRKFAKVTLIDQAHLKEGLNQSLHLADIGPDPLAPNFSFSVFAERLNRRPTGRIKNVLMDQSIIAGVGNIYSDEALWRVGINPEEPVKNIPENLMKELFRATLTVLKKGIDFGGDSMSDYRNVDGERGKFQEQHNAYRKTKQKCSKPGCDGIILRKIVGGRSAHFCSAHQKLLQRKR